ncbi:class F sortase [Streptomyces sp. MUM 203J]|uniref:class F sortase n=1 Tax=Streptomyces sp. MUM 203J TaxID=2791990 RepID=UPI001F04EF78|nr:class F sortase [Streptomyces sp. MUM 203J]MCH0542647.1 class F sortase [Streptomyces sp. MUM 203J]
MLVWAAVAGAASLGLALWLPAAPRGADVGDVPRGVASVPPVASHGAAVSVSVPGYVDPMPVDAVGASPQGELDVPASPYRVGWWARGARPGDPRGTVLLAGHIDSAEEGAGPFEALHDLPVGARVQVGAADGTRHTYRIVARRTYEASALPQDLFSPDEGRGRLVLVTCAGDFDPHARVYARNLVLYALPASTPPSPPPGG